MRTICLAIALALSLASPGWALTVDFSTRFDLTVEAPPADAPQPTLGDEVHSSLDTQPMLGTVAFDPTALPLATTATSATYVFAPGNFSFDTNLPAVQFHVTGPLTITVEKTDLGSGPNEFGQHVVIEIGLLPGPDVLAYVDTLTISLNGTFPGAQARGTRLFDVPWDPSPFSDQFLDLHFTRADEQATISGPAVIGVPEPGALAALALAALGANLLHSSRHAQGAG